MRLAIPLIIFLLITGCKENKTAAEEVTAASVPDPAFNHFKTINDIPASPGFKRLAVSQGSFGAWLRTVPLKEDRTVYLYNGNIKANQSAQFAVVDISTGKKDLQQCADAAMRLRAEYLFANKKYDSICFFDYNGKKYQWTGSNNRTQFDQYLQNVFGWCGSASLEKQLLPVNYFSELKAGDVFIKGGFPGHAMTVADVAVNNKGEKVYMLVQGYQPAQDMHVVIDPVKKELGPWYEFTAASEIITPEWTFYKSQLRKW